MDTFDAAGHTPRILKEYPDKIKILWAEGVHDGQGFRNIGHERKFLCIGGPLAGQYKASLQIEEACGSGTEEYCAFNRAQRHYRRFPRNKFTQVWIHISLLP